MQNNETENIKVSMEIKQPGIYKPLWCDCCGVSVPKKIYILSSEEFIQDYKLGAVCAGRLFEVSLTGNPYSALVRLRKKVNSMRFMEVEEIILGE